MAELFYGYLCASFFSFTLVSQLGKKSEIGIINYCLSCLANDKYCFLCLAQFTI